MHDAIKQLGDSFSILRMLVQALLLIMYIRIGFPKNDLYISAVQAKYKTPTSLFQTNTWSCTSHGQ